MVLWHLIRLSEGLLKAQSSKVSPKMTGENQNGKRHLDHSSKKKSLSTLVLQGDDRFQHKAVLMGTAVQTGR